MSSTQINPVCNLLYCRPGFEKEAASEIMQITQAYDINGYIKAKADSGYVGFYPTSPTSLNEFNQSIQFSNLIFARQSIFVSEIINNLPPTDRITPLLASIQLLELDFSQLLLETPDTNDGKEMSSFCKKFSTPLTIALEKKHLINKKAHGVCTYFFWTLPTYTLA